MEADSDGIDSLLRGQVLKDRKRSRTIKDRLILENIVKLEPILKAQGRFLIFRTHSHIIGVIF